MSKGIGLIELNELSDTLNYKPSYVLETNPYFTFFFYLIWGGIWWQGYTFLVLLEQGYWE